ncbi:MAG: hypothetical protein WB507_06130 [Solirubrobacterales bacterium]
MGRGSGSDHGAAAPRRQPPQPVETSEEALEKLELRVEELNALSAELKEHFADDSVLDDHLVKSILAMREAIARIEELEGN